MLPRQGIPELFATFIQFEGEYFHHWLVDPQLRRNLQRHGEKLPQAEAQQTFWALYWYRLWLTQPKSLARGHLSAYLQEVCYWAAQKITVNFASTQYSLTDCFQLAIAQIDRVLKGFNPQQSVSLKNYASIIFSNLMRETLRQRQEVDICTPWSLLRKISQKRLVESLESAGFSPEVIADYLLAWNCFKSIYQPQKAGFSRKLTAPKQENWEAMVTFYNSLSPGANMQPARLEKVLLSCAQAARAYLYPAVSSLNIPGLGKETGELLDDLAANTEESLLAQILAQQEAQTRRDQQTQVTAVLQDAIAKLDPQLQQLLQLYYAQGAKQQVIAQQLGIKQYTVSRRLSKARQELLQQLAQWSQQTLHISLSSHLLKDISLLLEDWLTNYYSK